MWGVLVNLVHSVIMWPFRHPFSVVVPVYVLLLKLSQCLLSYLYSNPSSLWPQKVIGCALGAGSSGESSVSLSQADCLDTSGSLLHASVSMSGAILGSSSRFATFSGTTWREKHSWSLLLDPQIHLGVCAGLGPVCPQILALILLWSVW